MRIKVVPSNHPTTVLCRTSWGNEQEMNQLVSFFLFSGQISGRHHPRNKKFENFLNDSVVAGRSRSVIHPSDLNYLCYLSESYSLITAYNLTTSLVAELGANFSGLT
ncbi:hypothetical protein K443DRAFT_166111 [Laccaria amethystina LaAM-08-1]|jgi:hypothetical protein|uniref:Uncharacterized protein n=1 Tax=Laccaria amethystina LaAM-08-1 TaxID=1095629 RepID=A0A0C9Y128_9AGAR|nr:hypothetical protein K443DRAFT_166111 [Laccaria amethystina LaAM-08-1]